MGKGIPRETDEEIAAQVQSDQIEAFAVLMERYEEKIKRYADKFLSDREEINDIVQEIFIKAYRNIESFDVNRKFSSWLYRIAHNELINAVKRKKRTISLSLVELDVFLPHQVQKENIEREIDRKKIKKEIEDCLDELELKYREPLILYYFEGLSYKDIADVMQIPISTVGIRIKRAKEKIKEKCKKLNKRL